VPYTGDNPPEVAKDLPAAALEIFISAYNGAWETYKDLPEKEREARAFATAWAGVRRKYKQVDGAWVEQSEAEMAAAELQITVELADRAALMTQAQQRARKYGIGIKADGSRTPPKSFPIAPDAYADPVNYAYPIDKAHIRAAESYFNQAGQREAGGYSLEEWAIMGKRIAAACSEHLGGKYIYQDGKITHLAEAGEPDIVAQAADRLVTLHALVNYTEAASDGQPVSHVEVAKVGSYTDAHGKAVEITEADIDRMIANFTAHAAGQDVPVDVMHEKREAGGWLRNVWRTGKTLMAEVAWNGYGAKLVGDKVFRYLSASIALPAWVLRSVSLVNFPAIKGMAPVELSEWLLSQPETVDQRGSPRARNSGTGFAPGSASSQPPHHGGMNMKEEEKLHEGQVDEEPTGGNTAPQLAEFSAALEAAKNEIVAQLTEQIVNELAEKRETMLTELRAEIDDERVLSEFVLSTTAQGRHALPVKPDELKAVLKELPKGPRQKMMDFLRNIAEAGTVDLEAAGTAAEGPDRRRLDVEVRQELKRQLANGLKIETFFAANPELGSMTDYDLAEFGK